MVCIAGVMIAIGLLMLAACNGGTPTPAPQPRSALWADRLGQPQDLATTEAEIAAAKSRAGGAGLYRDCGVQLEQ